MQVTVGPEAGFDSLQLAGIEPTFTVTSLRTGQVIVLPVAASKGTPVHVPTLSSDTCRVGQVMVGPTPGTTSPAVHDATSTAADGVPG